MSETNTITVLINQAPFKLPPNATLQDAVQCIGIEPPFAAAINLQFVPKSQYASHVLQTNDQIELISPITGG
ncbi:MAG: sulfur carrier protein ThiS [Burkholderiales bacterium]|jgi:sulfur carrier protein|nr:sulfur carrier protein ThiS [Burkholderiales bacterium]